MIKDDQISMFKISRDNLITETRKLCLGTEYDELFTTHRKIYEGLGVNKSTWYNWVHKNLPSDYHYDKIAEYFNSIFDRFMFRGRELFLTPQQFRNRLHQELTAQINSVAKEYKIEKNRIPEMLNLEQLKDPIIFFGAYCGLFDERRGEKLSLQESLLLDKWMNADVFPVEMLKLGSVAYKSNLIIERNRVDKNSLASFLNISAEELDEWLKGQSASCYNHAEKIAEFLDVQVGWLKSFYRDPSGRYTQKRKLETAPTRTDKEEFVAFVRSILDLLSNEKSSVIINQKGMITAYSDLKSPTIMRTKKEFICLLDSLSSIDIGTLKANTVK